MGVTANFKLAIWHSSCQILVHVWHSKALGSAGHGIVVLWQLPGQSSGMIHDHLRVGRFPLLTTALLGKGPPLHGRLKWIVAEDADLRRRNAAYLTRRTESALPIDSVATEGNASPGCSRACASKSASCSRTCTATLHSLRSQSIR